jgi:hypothetical protein
MTEVVLRERIGEVDNDAGTICHALIAEEQNSRRVAVGLI